MKKRTLLGATGLCTALILSIGLVACGGDDDGGDGASASPTAASASTPSGGNGAETLAVTAADFSLTLDKESLSKGASVAVEFTNTGSATHTVTFYADEDYTEAIPAGDSGRVDGGGNTSFTMSVPSEGDELYYRCEVHPSQMQGEVPLE